MAWAKVSYMAQVGLKDCVSGALAAIFKHGIAGSVMMKPNVSLGRTIPACLTWRNAVFYVPAESLKPQKQAQD